MKEDTMAEKTGNKCLGMKMCVRRLYIKQEALPPVTQEKLVKHLKECVACATYLNLIKEEWIVSTKS
jgi:hypothetical protein